MNPDLSGRDDLLHYLQLPTKVPRCNCNNLKFADLPIMVSGTNSDSR